MKSNVNLNEPKPTKMSKYYFQKHDEDCYPLNYHYDYMRENELAEMEVYEAIRDRNTGVFFCKKHEVIGEIGETCGVANCDFYEPRNGGKSGICKYHGFTYSQGKARIVKINQTKDQ